MSLLTYRACDSCGAERPVGSRWWELRAVVVLHPGGSEAAQEAGTEEAPLYACGEECLFRLLGPLTGRVKARWPVVR